MRNSILLIAFLFSLSVPLTAQVNAPSENKQIENRVEILEKKTDRLSEKISDFKNSSGIVLVLFGAFCALWAQNTNRNPWLWFFFGMFFSAVTIFFLLAKNSNDIQRRKLRNFFKDNTAEQDAAANP